VSSGSRPGALGRARGRLTEPELAHLQRLTRNAAVLADISFADILVLLPIDDSGSRLVVAAQQRPINSQTVHSYDLVGQEFDSAHRPLSAMALSSGELTDGGLFLPDDERWIRTLAVPVGHRGRAIAVLVREFSPEGQRVAGDLELTYFTVFRRLGQMIADGTYPFPVEAREHDHPPRVGDGMMLLDRAGTVEYLSPNASSALHRVGIHDDPTGLALADVGLEQLAIRSAYATKLPHTEEVERGGDNLVVRCIPLIEESEVAGSLVLVRDITELRDRDRLLLTKDATIAEIHHRVKNNLQTISSLLRLQSRRVAAPEAKAAIDESVRRIRSIAIVHEMLSHEAGDDVSFDDILVALIQAVREALLTPDSQIELRVEGGAGVLPSEVSTTLSVVVGELLQNAVDHAFPGSDGEDQSDEPAGPGGDEYEGAAAVVISVNNSGSRLEMEVRDNGVGIPEGFDIDQATGLGLTIVRTLVESELSGSATYRRAGHRGTVVAISVPLHPHVAPTSGEG
jgi:two-component sensor histidine kinase